MTCPHGRCDSPLLWELPAPHGNEACGDVHRTAQTCLQRSIRPVRSVGGVWEGRKGLYHAREASIDQLWAAQRSLSTPLQQLGFSRAAIRTHVPIDTR